MAGGSGRWWRRVLVGQVGLGFPGALLLWWQSSPVSVAVALIVLWASALICVAGLLGPQWQDERAVESTGQPAVPTAEMR